MNVTTFTMSLPSAGDTNEIMDALREAIRVQAGLGNRDAAQALAIIEVLAGTGLAQINPVAAFMTRAQATIS